VKETDLTQRVAKRRREKKEQKTGGACSKAERAEKILWDYSTFSERGWKDLFQGRNELELALDRIANTKESETRYASFEEALSSKRNRKSYGGRQYTTLSKVAAAAFLAQSQPPALSPTSRHPLPLPLSHPLKTKFQKQQEGNK